MRTESRVPALQTGSEVMPRVGLDIELEASWWGPGGLRKGILVFTLPSETNHMGFRA